MRFKSLTLRSIQARAVLLKLKRPVVARIATLPDWPMIRPEPLILHAQPILQLRKRYEMQKPKRAR